MKAIVRCNYRKLKKHPRLTRRAVGGGGLEIRALEANGGIVWY